MSFEDLINKNADRLNQNDMQLVSFLLRNRDTIGELKSTEIADRVYSSPASLTRLSKKLGFSGFTELRYVITAEAKEQDQVKKNHTEALIKDMNDTIKLLSQTDLIPTVNLMHDASHIYLYGTDWGEKRACNLLARNFLACKMTLYTIPSITELKWLLPTLHSDDLLIVISYRGENVELNEGLMSLKLRKVPILSITPLSKNSTASRADYNLYYCSTRLDIQAAPGIDYNFFSPLEFVVDATFRYYLDVYGV
ncbi:MurR/RpiR family transcriptional regulator [Lacticaseibacillus manihotivorans]|jgi:RpiR family glv operon transcriptional regulator|uniref:RpiR family transcriptional regulator n=2 Tax=Lacticaseibacillus manihotivorans TaxID=88233 RepID=A0A0R1RB05_9LACO|nr:MurR/RpiR family transcriptional regulator [Lacticaseibacillus manihotivorans]KRL52308.1 RpiR family transcriptional regulator [Lacticaseibacillus manihotivorans DSM 13343 = JCM 12514]QFQ90091.1 SIS domain-containing protein [Lacticaseibacillus manihotivorans]